MKNFVKEFREFIDKGNVMDLAVAVIIGGAFTAIVKSLTDNIITPLIAFIFGGDGAIQGLVVPGTNIDFGAFIGAIINFLIIALIVFLMVKGMNKMRAAGEKAVATRDVNGRPVKLVEEAPRMPLLPRGSEAGRHALPPLRRRVQQARRNHYEDRGAVGRRSNYSSAQSAPYRNRAVGSARLCGLPRQINGFCASL